MSAGGWNVSSMHLGLHCLLLLKWPKSRVLPIFLGTLHRDAPGLLGTERGLSATATL